MEETIELREIIDSLLKGKWIIASVTAICMLIAGIASWFILSEKYESTAVVQIRYDIQDTGVLNSYIASEFTPQVFSQRMTNSEVLNAAFEKEGMVNKYNSSNIAVETKENILTLSYTSNSSKNAQKELQTIINVTKNEMVSTVRNTLQNLENTYSREAESLSKEVETLINNYNTIIRTNNLPELLILQTILTTGITLNLTDEQTAALSTVSGSIQNELLQLQLQIEVKSQEYNKVLVNYQSAKIEQESFNPDPYFNLIIKPTLADGPSSPNKVLNVTIGFVLGVILGSTIVIFRNYWRSSAPAK